MTKQAGELQPPTLPRCRANKRGWPKWFTKENVTHRAAMAMSDVYPLHPPSTCFSITWLLSSTIFCVVYPLSTARSLFLRNNWCKEERLNFIRLHVDSTPRCLSATCQRDFSACVDHSLASLAHSTDNCSESMTSSNTWRRSTQRRTTRYVQ